MTSFFEKLKKGMKIEEIPEEEKKKEPLPKEEKKVILQKPEKENWLEEVGQLAVDVYETEQELVIQSAIAGIKKEDLDITLENDVLTIKGKRERPEVQEIKNSFYQECYWGKFQREIVLPVEINPESMTAFFQEGVLTIRLPKMERKKKRKIEIKT